MNGPLPAQWAPYLLSVLRIVAAGLFMVHGTMKLFAMPVPSPGSPFPLFTQFWFAGVLEVFGGALLLLGLLTRPVAFVLSGQMAVAYFQVHMPRGAWPILNAGEPAVLFCFVWLYFAAAGAGPWSLDALRRK